MGKDDRREARERRRRRRIRRRKEQNRQLELFGQINWDVYTHRNMWDMIQSAKPAQMGDKAYRWADLAKKADDATEEVRKTAERLLQSWRGPSAVAAAETISELTRWGAEASGTARTIGDRLDTYTHAVQEAQRRMPEPVHPHAEEWFAEGRDVSVLDGPQGSYLLEQLLDDQQPSQRQKERRKAEAIEVMKSYEDTSRGVHDTLPQFSGRTTEIGAGPLGGISAPSLTPSAPELPGTLPDYGATTAAGVAGASGLPGAGGLGAMPGGGAAGLGAGGGAFGGGGFLAPGPQTGSGSAAAAAGRAAAGLGMRGSAVPFGMVPPAGGQRGENDTEHHDKYGLGLDLMDDMPPAYPSVFGDD